MVPCVIFEDEHVLVVNKPAGWNTHAPSPFAGEGIYDWLKHREPRWASLAIIHRLDKETSGVMVFGKTPLANRSLTEQFARHLVRKKYLLLTDRSVPRREFTVKTALVRVGEKYAGRSGGEMAETKFRSRPMDGRWPVAGGQLIEAFPQTGRTHQIRVHASENGFPILGDTLYGGTPAARVCLHAAEICFADPATGETMTFCAPPNFDDDPRLSLREAMVDSEATNSFRVIHGASDGWPGWFVEKLGDFLLSQSDAPITAAQTVRLKKLAGHFSSRGAYHKILSRKIRGSATVETSPQFIFGEPAPARFEILENGVRYELSFNEGYSVGLFLDQRDNRRRFLTEHVAAGLPELPAAKARLLNVFAYTCGFSVCAAKAGTHTTSLDLSKKYLDWGRRNFQLNGLDPAAHDFIFGDAFDWLRRLAKKGRPFDAVVLDPPTFSQSKEHGAFRAEKDYGGLAIAAVKLVRPGGFLFASTNAADWQAEDFLQELESVVQPAGRNIVRLHYFPQPPDFPVSREQPAYLKTAWLHLD